jgi:hypothetical protein
VWWACGYRWQASPLARLLLDRDPATAPILNTRSTKLFDGMTMNDVTDRLRQLARASEGTIDLTEVPERVADATWTPVHAAESGELIVAERGVRADLPDSAWRRWSFTSLASTLHDAEATIPGDVGTAVESPVAGGADETNIEAELAVETAAAGAAASTDPSVRGGCRTAQPGSGSGRSRTLCSNSSTSPRRTSDADLRVLVADRARRGWAAAGRTAGRHRPRVGGARTARAAVRRTIARGHRSGRSARGADLRHAARCAARRRRHRPACSLPAAAVTELLLAALPEHDPARPCLLALPRELQRVDIAGWMYGSIDAVFRITGGHGRPLRHRRLQDEPPPRSRRRSGARVPTRPSSQRR